MRAGRHLRWVIPLGLALGGVVACTQSTPSSKAPAAERLGQPQGAPMTEAATSEDRAAPVSPASPAPPPPAETAPVAAPQAPRATSPSDAPPRPAPPPSMAPAPSEAKASMLSVAKARGELEVALRSLDGRPGTCASACRALASMERATAHLCETARERDERRACEEATRTLKAADARVRSSCGTCR